jgi:RNA polymerase sigma-70 factor (ECF subfamily)
VEPNPKAQDARSSGAREQAATAVPGATETPALPAVRRGLRGVGGASARSGTIASARAMAALPDAQLVALGTRGDTNALEQLYRRHAAFAIHLATRIEGSARDVEDIVHDAFIRAIERLPDLTDPSAFRAWLGAIVVHAVRSRMRRTRLMTMLGMGKGADPVDLDAIASPDASPHVRAQIAQIYALLRTLPTDERISWTLRAIEGHDLETVARLVRCSLATVKRRISRAQRFLDDHFVEVHNEDDAAPSTDPAPS